MADEPRILTADETTSRRGQQARSTGGIVALCAHPDCPRATFNGPWCVQHRPGRAFEPARTVAFDLDRDQIAALRQQVEADAAPIFVVAMNWIARQQVAHLGITTDTLVASIDRIGHELEQPR